MQLKDIKYMDTFIRACYDKHIICFGAGKGFITFIKVAIRIGLIDSISTVLDNDESKHGKTIKVENYSFLVSNPNLISKIVNPSEYVFVITAKKSENISKQIREYSHMHDVNIFLYRNIVDDYALMYARSIKYPTDLRIERQQLIPKVINYCWFGETPIPEQFKIWINGWKDKCPDYEIVRWDEKNYDVSRSQFMIDAYNAKKWAFVADYARLDIIYRFGGIYLDTDVEIVKNIDDLLYQKAFAGCQQVPDERFALGLGFGAIKGLPIFKKMRDSYDNIQFRDYTHQEAHQIKLDPDIQTENMINWGWHYENKVMHFEDITIYPTPILNGLIGDRLLVTDYTYSIHHYAGTWV